LRTGGGVDPGVAVIDPSDSPAGACGRRMRSGGGVGSGVAVIDPCVSPPGARGRTGGDPSAPAAAAGACRRLPTGGGVGPGVAVIDPSACAGRMRTGGVVAPGVAVIDPSASPTGARGRTGGGAGPGVPVISSASPAGACGLPSDLRVSVPYAVTTSPLTRPNHAQTRSSPARAIVIEPFEQRAMSSSGPRVIVSTKNA
jgi:hypothetical protein